MADNSILSDSQFQSVISVGAELGSYTLESVLGTGAMGTVFKAKHRKLGREVAIKVLNPDFADRKDVVKRFFREARVVNQINHEHIVEVTDFVEDQPGRAYLVMELLRGKSLRDILKAKKKKRLPLSSFVGIVLQVCDALGAAHERGIVHRDLKPDNVFVISRGGTGEYVKVLDFGVAKLNEQFDGEGTKNNTAEGTVIGTPHYMSPEQAWGQEVNDRTDVWAAGVLLYEMLAGALPFDGQNFLDLAHKLVQKPPPPLPKKTPRGEKIPPALAQVVMKCLAKEKKDRFASMKDLAKALQPFSPRRAKKRASRLPAFLWISSIAAAGAMAYLFGLPARLHLEKWRPMDAQTRPVATAAPTRAAPPEAPRALPPRVKVEVYSDPAGATVTRLDTGAAIGKTPAAVFLDRKDQDLPLRFTLAGHQSITASVSLATGGSANVALRPLPPPAVRKPATTKSTVQRRTSSTPKPSTTTRKRKPTTTRR